VVLLLINEQHSPLDMHELGIADSIVNEIRDQAKQRPEARVVTVGVTVGEMSGVNADSLAFCFESLVRDTELKGVKLKIERTHHRHRCSRCEREFRVWNLDSRCACGETQTQFIAGDELEISYLEVDEP
jgi:hydrogenase nickel incorporation protein HypA/HybF